MDKNTWIGFLLIASIIVGFSLLNRPSKEQLAERQRINDSIAYVEQLKQQEIILEQQMQAAQQTQETAVDATLLRQQMQAAYGPFAPAAEGEEQQIVLENSKVCLYLSTKGGRIARACLKEYKAYGDSINDLCLFRADESALNFTLITANNRILGTRNLYFEALPGMMNEMGTQQVLRLHTDIEDCYMDFVYTLPEDEYMFSFAIVPHNMQHVLAQNVNSLEMQWHQLIPQQERGRVFEERYSRLQYMCTNGEIEQLSESKSDSQKESGRVRWIAFKDQFFSTVMIADDAFTSLEVESTPQNKATNYVKEYDAHANVAFDITGNAPTTFRYYLGPNHYNTLKAYDADLTGENRLQLKELVPLGWKIVAWINKALIIPMFDIFTSWGLHIGWVILLMTLVIKLIILPFVFASYKSSAKMRVLKPQMDAINEKYPPEKMQERQQEMMKLYQRAGVSPMSGCLPMLFQFPVLMAMFWFLPTAIELRGKSFLWADDLSTYDAIFTWNYNLPLIGDHLSLFCLLMTICNIVYTYINMQSQAGGNDPSMKMMKWMMYLMPLMFFFWFNDYAAGLSYYYLVSLFMTIAQTMIFRWSIDDEKLLKQMEENAKKKAGKPKSGLMARLEKMQQEQLRYAREQAKANQRR